MFNLRILRAYSFFLATTLTIVVFFLPGCERLKNYSDVERVQRAKEFRDKGNVQAAVIELKNALQKNAKNSEARWLLGEAYVELGSGKDAENELQRALELGVNPEALKVPLGTALLQQHEYKRVLTDVQISPSTSKANMARIKVIQGEANLALGDVLKGCGAFAEAIVFDAAYVPAYLGSARCETIKGSPERGFTELDKALKLEPKNSMVWATRGNLEGWQQHFEDAEKAYTTALQYQSTNIYALLGRAGVRMQLGRFEGANEDLDALFRINKENMGAVYLRGIVQFRQGKYADAKTSFENVLKAQPGHTPTILWLGLTALLQKNYEQAAAHLNAYILAVPNATLPKAVLAFVQAKMGNTEVAKETLQKLSNVNLESSESLATVGQAYMLTGDAATATQYLSKAVEKKPDSGESRIKLAATLIEAGRNTEAIEQLQRVIQSGQGEGEAEQLLIEVFIREKKFDEAKKTIASLEAKRPRDPMPLNYHGGLLVMTGDQAGGIKAFQRALELQPGFPPAANNLALLAIQNKNLDEARQYYNMVLKHQPAHLPTLLALYNLDLMAGKTEQARKTLEDAISKYPKTPAPSILLAQDYLNMGNFAKVLEVTRDVSAANPDNLELLVLRGEAYLGSGDGGGALANFKRLVQLQPSSAEAHYRLGKAYAAVQDPTASLKALNKALAIDPNHLGVKLALARIALGENKLNEANRLAGELGKKYPESPDVVLIQAELLMRQKKVTESIGLLEGAQKRLPDSRQLAFALIQTRAGAGDVTGALQIIEGWQKAHPKDLAAILFLGEFYRSLGRGDAAIGVYEKALAIAPNSPEALNNLAWLKQKSDPAKAVQYAEIANSSRPGDPSLMDTLGWLLIGRGDIVRGLELLQNAHKLAPKVLIVQYHYAVALEKAGQKGQAKRELEALISSGSKFQEEAAARELLKRL